jgi:hypothetical protein
MLFSEPSEPGLRQILNRENSRCLQFLLIRVFKVRVDCTVAGECTKFLAVARGVANQKVGRNFKRALIGPMIGTLLIST